MSCHSLEEILSQLLIENINAVLVIYDNKRYIEFNVLKKDKEKIKEFLCDNMPCIYEYKINAIK